MGEEVNRAYHTEDPRREMGEGMWHAGLAGGEARGRRGDVSETLRNKRAKKRKHHHRRNLPETVVKRRTAPKEQN